MRSDQHTINGLTAYKLGLEQTTADTYIEADYEGSAGAFYDIEIAVRHADGTETELLPWTQFAYRTTTGGGFQTYNFSCPQTSLSATDAIVVRLRTRIGDGSAVAVFITEQLGASSLPAATWTFYVYTYCYRSATMSYSLIRFGSSTYNTSVENFQWVSAGVAYVQEVSDSGIVVDVLGKGVLAVKSDSFFGFDVGVKSLITCVSDRGVAFDFLAKDFWKYLADTGVGLDWFIKNVALCFLDTSVSLDMLLRGVGKSLADFGLGFDWYNKNVACRFMDAGVSSDSLKKGVEKCLADAGISLDWFNKDLARCFRDMGLLLDLLMRGVEKSLADFGLVSDWKSFDLLSCVFDVLKGLDWIPFGVPHVVELRDVFGVYELFNLPPLISDLNRVLDRVDAYVKVGVQTWLYLWDRALVTDYTYPWDVGRVKELVVAVGWVLRDYPLTDWELRRNERIADYLSEHKVFRLSDFQRFVWFEQIRMQEQRAFGGAKQMFYYRSRYIENFCKFLFMVLEERGMVRKAGLDSYVVVEAPSVEFINEITRRRWFDIWSFC
jgi:hypothetical protein